MSFQNRGDQCWARLCVVEFANRREGCAKRPGSVPSSLISNLVFFLRAVIAAVVVAAVVAASRLWATVDVSDYVWSRSALAAVPVPDHNRLWHVEYLA